MKDMRVSNMVVCLDSSVWIAVFRSQKNSELFKRVIRDSDSIIVPTPCLYEVARDLASSKGFGQQVESALQIMKQHLVVSLDESASIEAAQILSQHDISACDRFIYALARQHDAILWTQDSDFLDLPQVEYRKA